MPLNKLKAIKEVNDEDGSVTDKTEQAILVRMQKPRMRKQKSRLKMILNQGIVSALKLDSQTRVN